MLTTDLLQKILPMLITALIASPIAYVLGGKKKENRKDLTAVESATKQFLELQRESSKQVAELQKTINDLHQEVGNLQKQVVTLSAEQHAMKTILEERTNSLNDVRGERDRLLKQSEAMTKEINALRKKIA
jgi:septal ring factor EnvC (AmiA/AmiB activator)